MNCANEKEIDTLEKAYARLSDSFCDTVNAARSVFKDNAEARGWMFDFTTGEGSRLFAAALTDGVNDPQQVERIKRSLEKLEDIHDKEAFSMEEMEMEEMPIDDVEREVTGMHMENFLEAVRERLEEWEQLCLDFPELAPGDETGEDSPAEVEAKLYHNILNIRGLLKILTLVRTDRNSRTDPDDEDSLVISGDGAKITVERYIEEGTGKDLAVIDVNHHKLLIKALMAAATKPKLNKNEREVSFSLKSFCADTGGNITRCKKAVERAAETLLRESWRFTAEVYEPGRGRGIVKYKSIVDSVFIGDDGLVCIKFGKDFWESVCTQRKILPVPTEVLKIHVGRHPHAFFLYLKLAESKNHNRNKPWEGRISMKTAIASCPLLPTEKEVRQGNRNYRARIIKPILADALSLKGKTIGSIKFLLSSREFNKATGKEETKFKPISYKRALELDYETARDRLVIFADKWLDYPAAQVDRARARHAERLEEAARKREVKDAETIIKAEQIREKRAKEAE